MGDFEERPLSTGVGEEHVNRFRVYFAGRGRVNARDFVGEFMKNFPAYFSIGNLADTDWGSRNYGSYPTLKFTLHSKVPEFHDDWVAIKYRRDEASVAGFAVQTLKRNFEDESDDRAAAFSNDMGNFALVASPALAIVNPALGYGAVVGGVVAKTRDLAVHVNQYHFLAGRRSWMFCDAASDPDNIGKPPAPNTVFFLETAAIEKLSAIWFEPPEQVALLSKAFLSGFDMRETVKRMWCRMLLNYVQFNGLKLLDAPEASPPVRFVGWERYTGIYWNIRHGERLGAMRLHPYLGE